VNAADDMITLSLSTLTDRLDDALDLLGEVLAEPAFDPADFEKARAEAIASLKAASEDPGYLADRALLAMLYPGHPYGTPVGGTETTLASLTLDDCRTYWRRVAGPSGAVITAAGDVKGKELARRIGDRLDGWLAAKGSVFDQPPPLPPLEGKARFEKINGPFTQTTVLLGERGITRADPSYYALQVFNYTLGGGGFSSRLLDEIRDNRGLAYSVGSGFDARLLAGPFTISLQTRNATAKEALALVHSEVKKALAGGITEKERKDAQAYLVGTYPRRYDTNAKMARFLAAAIFYGLGTDYDRIYPERIRAVTREQAAEVARTHLLPEALDTVVVGNLKEAGFGGP
jgi:zinc protease